MRKARPPAIKVSGLAKSFGAHEVIHDLDLSVPTASVYGLLGPNGAGKTTLVRILATLLRPSAGTVQVAGIDVMRAPRAARTRIGLVGQNAALDDILTGRQNLQLFGQLLHLGARAASGRAADLLDSFGLTDAADRPVASYSGGMRRRLDLAAGLILSPPVLFLDEPTTGLDPRARAEVWTAVHRLIAAGTTVLLTTQYLEEADQLADRVGILDHGAIVAEGSPAELKEHMGADRLEVLVADDGSLARARSLIVAAADVADADARVDAERLTVSIPAREGLATMARVITALQATHPALKIQDVALRRPSLDEVFLSLTTAPTTTLQETRA